MAAIEEKGCPWKCPVYIWSMMFMVWDTLVGQFGSAVLDLLLPGAILHLLLGSWKVLYLHGNSQDTYDCLHYFHTKSQMLESYLEKTNFITG